VDEQRLAQAARPEITREILRYFMKNPGAKDTLEGIARWWLERNRVERTVDEVAQSLHVLVAQGLIIRRQARAALPYYLANPAKRREIAEFLDGH
jgi:hypothetical protein